MNYTDFPENLEKLRTPIIICDEKGLVIYKNSAAVRNVRLPRRNTSMLTHLGQTEKGELCRLFERKKPSVLTVQTGDRNARALVTHYTRDGKECSLWVFISLLQTGSVSGMFAEMDASLTAIARDICKCIQSIDEFSRALPDHPTGAGLSYELPYHARGREQYALSHEVARSAKGSPAQWGREHERAALCTARSYALFLAYGQGAAGR